MANEDDEDDEEVLRPDAHDVVHVVYFSGSWRKSVCASRNQNLTGNGLVWGTPCPTNYPTCVFCVYYRARWQATGSNDWAGP